MKIVIGSTLFFLLLGGNSGSNQSSFDYFNQTKVTFGNLELGIKQIIPQKNGKIKIHVSLERITFGLHTPARSVSEIGSSLTLRANEPRNRDAI